MTERTGELAQREGNRLIRKELFADQASPFQMIERFADEIDRVFDDFGLGRIPLAYRWGQSGVGSPWRGPSRWNEWTPDIDVFQRNHELVVRADVPGMRKEDVKVDVTDDAITIQGERHQELEEERASVYRTERRHGTFSRVISLPEGAMANQAQATFKDGVLEITVPAPPEQVRRGRRLEISEPSPTKK